MVVGTSFKKYSKFVTLNFVVVSYLNMTIRKYYLIGKLGSLKANDEWDSLSFDIWLNGTPSDET